MIPGKYRRNKCFNFTAIDKVHLKCDCVNGSIVNGIREPILYCFALRTPPIHKISEEATIKLFEKITKPLLSQIKFYLEDDNNKAVDFNGKTISFNCQLFRI